VQQEEAQQRFRRRNAALAFDCARLFSLLLLEAPALTMLLHNVEGPLFLPRYINRLGPLTSHACLQPTLRLTWRPRSEEPL
jgi:hypothetical protein